MAALSGMGEKCSPKQPLRLPLNPEQREGPRQRRTYIRVTHDKQTRAQQLFHLPRGPVLLQPPPNRHQERRHPPIRQSTQKVRGVSVLQPENLSVQKARLRRRINQQISSKARPKSVEDIQNSQLQQPTWDEHKRPDSLEFSYAQWYFPQSGGK